MNEAGRKLVVLLFSSTVTNLRLNNDYFKAFSCNKEVL